MAQKFLQESQWAPKGKANKANSLRNQPLPNAAPAFVPPQHHTSSAVMASYNPQMAMSQLPDNVETLLYPSQRTLPHLELQRLQNLVRQLHHDAQRAVKDRNTQEWELREAKENLSLEEQNLKREKEKSARLEREK